MFQRLTITPLATVALAVAALAAATGAQNIDLVTLPRRQSVQLTIYNSEDVTLVKETRYLTFKRGANRLQFAWTNTLIDPTSIELRPLERAGDIEVVSTIFPGQKPQHLIWNVDSRYSGMAKVEVSYFISGLTWKMDYVATCNPAETSLRFQGFVRVFNKSGESFENAEVRLIVGTINLVEKVADLARRHGIAVPKKDGRRFRAMKRKVALESFAKAAAAEADAAPAAAGIVSAPKRIVKEGLSEYFMFSVPGTETITNGWSKRMQALDAEEVEFDIVHRVRDFQYGNWPVRFFIFTNDPEHRLGESPLPDGLVRLFKENGRDGLVFLGEQQVRYVPVKAKAEINLGPDPLVVYRKRPLETHRINFRFHRDRQGREWVRGWDERQTWNDEIRNYTGKRLVLELRLRFGGDVDFASEMKTGVFDYQTVEAKLTVDAGKTRAYPYVVTRHNGTNAKQSRVKLVRGR
jgi:hypothetical protein